MRISKNSRGIQLNAGRSGLYYRKQLISKKQLQELQENEPITEIEQEKVVSPKFIENKKITKSPEQEYFEFYLSLFTLAFIISFILLFIKPAIGIFLLITFFFLRKMYVNKNLNKYEIYKANPEPQLYYLGKSPNQIKELQKQAEAK